MFGNSFGFGFPSEWSVPAGPQKFQQYFRCYPVAMMPGTERESVNYGGKVVLPPSALNKLTMLHITYPMLFEIRSEQTGRVTHGGVLEFIAEEGRVYLPQWMMENLDISPGSLVEVGSIDLPSGLFVKIEPQSTDFLEISDPKAVLENALRNFSTLTVGDIIQILYNKKVYSIKVLEAKPESSSHSVCVVETDLEVDFAPPVGYVEPSVTPSTSSTVPSRSFGTPVNSMTNSIGYDELLKKAKATSATSFDGDGHKLSNRSSKRKSGSKHVGSSGGPESDAENIIEVATSVDAPALDLPFGTLFFGYPVIPAPNDDEDENKEENNDVTFRGQGQSLRQGKKRKDSFERSSSIEGGRTKTHLSSPEVIELD